MEAMNDLRDGLENSAKLQAIFEDVLAVDPAEYRDDLHQDHVPAWDSMGVVMLITEIEAAFDVELDLMEFSRFVSVGAIKNVLREHGITFD
jgi:acyl carrier protein